MIGYKVLRGIGLAALFLLLCSRAVTAQTPPSSTAEPASPAAQTQAGSAVAQNMETPLANKVLGQVPFVAHYAFQGEATFILQHLFAFPSRYSGPNSLISRQETELSHTYTLYLGARPTPRLEVYVNPELALGNGVSAGGGLAGYSNGDLIGQPNLRPEPYLARFFVRWRVPLRRSGTPKQAQAVPPGTNLIGGELPASRLVITAGKYAISDQFDVNSYANNARIQFFNNAFVNNLAYDMAAETRGYNLGLMASWVNPAFALRMGTFAMPTTAGGPDLAYNFANEHSDQMELTLQPHLLSGHAATPMIVRLLAYRNVATMGRYRDALEAQSAGMAPDITTVRRSGAVKYGFGLNFEQALGDGGATGIFGRAGWNDGSTESFSYAEADRFVSFGGQLSGAHWGRPHDVLGVGAAQSDLSGVHKAYLAAGGLGLSLGDGRLNYGPEQILEGYYAYQLSKAVTLSLDYQFINNPGYNRDRGPVNLVAMRMHLTF
ncbi:MAG: porin [Chthonomonadaceae bacterium]|nr:porin [Chthonomonadaceae bacterium]